MVNSIFLVLACQGSHDDYHEDPLGYSFDLKEVTDLLENLEKLLPVINLAYLEKEEVISYYCNNISLEEEYDSELVTNYTKSWQQLVIQNLDESQKKLVPFFKVLNDVDYFYMPSGFKYKEVNHV